ncbi:RNA methyltransferase [Janthinobacterium agaricidamnosum]|uniref:site-specific DNA-methyltransferase (cytosine-N(4)-specific) n=1 Tax=Janthinobacterium agaricidamnosum TaxID=55508 RepID=A0A3G2EI22_9BURK|nr:RNA methyltransferase [Janthinobacterium agaricidamnosum]
MSQAFASTRLAEVDWSFSQRSKAPAIEGIHPYPAKFIGDIPRAFIESLEIPSGTAVFDPFCGSGTTLVEAQRAGYASVGIDLNPIACLLATVKTSALPCNFEQAVTDVMRIARSIQTAPSSDIPNVNHWFKADIQLAVSSIAMTIAREEFLPWLPQLRLALSSILVRVSNQDSDTRYAAVEKNVNREDVFSYFLTATAKLLKALSERDWDLTTTKIIEGNTLQISPQQINLPIGLVITSPPYPNAYEYWLYHKYRMWWLGFDPLAVKEHEIGARAHFFKKNPHTADFFVDQMRTTFSLINSVLVSKGYICFVVGRSKIHGEIIDNGDIIERIAKEFNLALVSRFEREIKANRKSFNLSHANIKTESMLVFQKN